MSDSKDSHKAALESISGLGNGRELPADFIGSTGHGECKVKVVDKITPETTLDEILVFARKAQASDVHICTSNPIIFRKYGSLIQCTEEALSADHVEKLLRGSLKEPTLNEFIQSGDREFVYTIEGSGRYRVTLMKQRLGWDFTARIIPMSFRRFEDSGLPQTCQDLTRWAQGLILVTGPAGCGKTSTLATLIETINESRSDHIITIENPIEIVFEPKRCQITQREVNSHTLSQANALRAALREDPDIIVVSELRDLETIQLAVTAAETGHLVFGTMNTNDAAQTISSLIDSFPPEDQSIITNMISESLRGVISQQLVPKVGGTGIVPAHEILIVNTAVANLIRERKIEQLNNAMATGKSAGMVLLDNSLLNLVESGIIDGYEAFVRAINPNLFAQYAKADG